MPNVRLMATVVLSVVGFTAMSFVPVTGAFAGAFESSFVNEREVSESVWRTDLFVAGTNRYHTYRIPSIIVTKRGTLLAFCERRRKSRSDTGDIDLVRRRSA